MKGIKAVCKSIDTFTEMTGRAFSFITLITLGVIIFEVFMRRILNRPQIWTMDVIVMSFSCYVVLICAYGLLKKSFVAVDVLYAILPGIVKHVLHVITYLIFLVPFVFKLTPVAYRFFWKAYSTHELGYSVWQPVTWPVKLALFIGLLLLSVQGISEILKHVDWIIEYFHNGRKDPAISTSVGNSGAVVVENAKAFSDADGGNDPAAEEKEEP